MLHMCAKPIERCIGQRHGNILLWHNDLKQHASGDFSIAIARANYNLEDQSQVYTSPSATYVGVYDGHGGPEAYRFVNSRLFPFMHKLDSVIHNSIDQFCEDVFRGGVRCAEEEDLVAEYATEQGGIAPDVIKKAFSATEEKYFQFVKHQLPVRPQIASVGSCCLVGTISNDELHFANLGDSRVVLGQKVSVGGKPRVVAERLSRDHNV
ncbi:probable protein phosphatase 2C 63 [Tanacetum coccineum]